MRLPKISCDPDINWRNDSIQFPRLIAELMAAGAFTPEVISSLCDQMDLDADQIDEVIDRAQTVWDHIKEAT